MMEIRDQVEALFETAKSFKLSPPRISVLVFTQHYIKARFKVPEVISSQKRRVFCLKFLELALSRDMSCVHQNTLFNICEMRLGWLKDFEKAVTDIAISLENLLEIFDLQTALNTYLSEHSSFSQYGQLALFIRRIIAVFECMSYFEILDLQKKVVLYQRSGKRAFNTSVALQEITFRNQRFFSKKHQNSIWTTKQAESFILRQMSLLQFADYQATAPIDIKLKLDEILSADPCCYSALFLGFMNYLRLRDVFASIDCLHRTFDNNRNKELNPVRNNCFQYAAFSLAVLHIELNHRFLGYICLKETITLSRLSLDNRCLKLVYSWRNLLRLGKNMFTNVSAPKASTPFSFYFIIAAARLAYEKPADISGKISEIDAFMCQNSLRCFYIDSVGYATIWMIFGKSGLCSLYAQVSSKQKHMLSPKHYLPEYCPFALLSYFAIANGESKISLAILRDFKSSLRNPGIKSWLVSKYCISNSFFIGRAQWQRSLETCNTLCLANLQIGILELVSSLLSRLNMVDSQRKICKLGRVFKRNHSVNLRVLMMQSICQITNPHVPSQLVKTLCTTLANGMKRHVSYYVSKGNMIVSNIVLSMGMAGTTNRILDFSEQNISSHGTTNDFVEWAMLFVESLIQIHGSSSLKIKKIEACSGLISRIIIVLKKLHAYSDLKDLFRRLAIWYNGFGMNFRRNKYSYMFKYYDQKYPD